MEWEKQTVMGFKQEQNLFSVCDAHVPALCYKTFVLLQFQVEFNKQQNFHNP